MWSITRDSHLRDRYLLAALVLALVLSGHGLWWGWVECWNPDELALRGVSLEPPDFLAPAGFLKPPFHTYLNFFLSLLPVKAAEKALELATGQPHDFSVAMLYMSRLIQLTLFLAMVYFSYRIGERASGKWAGRLVALITATSAGFVLQAHFLTADLPVTFWMVVAFWLAQSIPVTGTMRSYVLAGLFTGIATATKYNGLAIGIAIPLFHLFVTPRPPLLKLLFDPRLVIGVGMVLVGFVLANPYSVFDFPRFSADFIYNYVTTPIYGGEEVGRHTYMQFVVRTVEIVGYPMAVLLALGAAASVAHLRRAVTPERATIVAALGVFLVYFYKFGSFPRLEVRFVLPALPFLFIAAVPALGRSFERRKAVAATIFGVLLGYNLIASTVVGYRFAHDPRMAAQAWVAANVPQGAHMESTEYVPAWNRYPGVEIKDERAPGVSGRKRLFSKRLASDPKLLATLTALEDENDVGWYTLQALAARAPQFIALDNLYFKRFLLPPKDELYPEVRDYFTRLLSEDLGYRIVFDEQTSPAPAWLYPRDIAFVDNRMIILQRMP